MAKKEKILTDKQVAQKIKRIAYEIYENNYAEKELVIAGIYENGYNLAKKIQRELKKIADVSIILVKVTLDKFSPLQSEIKLNCKEDKLNGKSVIIVDDVLNTGRTLAYSLKPFLNIEMKKVETAVLVNRRYKTFPVSANYTGLEISTMMSEEIVVNLSSKDTAVYLK